MCSLALERLGDDSKHEARRCELVDLRQHMEAQTKCPVSSLPIEILLMVFELSRRPVVISHVCRRWREVALSQPTLWRSLVLAGPGKKASRKVKTWYKRSRGRIVELSIHKSLAASLFPAMVDSMHPEDRVMRTDILALLRQFDLTELKQCHTEDLQTLLFLYALYDGNIYVHQHLETLSISHSHPKASIFAELEFSELPWKNLRALSITNEGCNWAGLSTSMCHLTSFEFRVHVPPTDLQHIHQFLQANPGLEKLVIDVPPISQVSMEHSDSLTLVNLRYLELSGVVSFRLKSFPSLQILRLTGLSCSMLTWSDLFKDEVTSFTELVELTARDCALKTQVLASVLLRAAKLEILYCTNLDNDIAESLTRPCMALLRDATSDDSILVPTKLPILCPALSMLDLSRSPNLKTGPVMRIVKERIALAASEDGGRYQLLGEDGDRGVSCIQVLKVDECPNIEAEMLPWFRKNVPQFSCRYEVRRRR